MNEMFRDALAFLDAHESKWGVKVNRREYLLGLIDRIGYSELREAYILELAGLTDEQLATTKHSTPTGDRP